MKAQLLQLIKDENICIKYYSDLLKNKGDTAVDVRFMRSMIKSSRESITFYLSMLKSKQ